MLVVYGLLGRLSTGCRRCGRLTTVERLREVEGTVGWVVLYTQLLYVRNNLLA